MKLSWSPQIHFFKTVLSLSKKSIKIIIYSQRSRRFWSIPLVRQRNKTGQMKYLHLSITLSMYTFQSFAWLSKYKNNIRILPPNSSKKLLQELKSNQFKASRFISTRNITILEDRIIILIKVCQTLKDKMGLIINTITNST